jgi:hypothetical protein
MMLASTTHTSTTLGISNTSVAGAVVVVLAGIATAYVLKMKKTRVQNKKRDAGTNGTEPNIGDPQDKENLAS